MDRASGHLPTHDSPQSLKRKLQEVRAQMKHLQSRQCSKRRSIRRASSLTPAAERLVMAVYVLSNYNSSIAGKLLLSYGKTHLADASLQEAERAVENMFMSFPDDVAQTLSYPEDAAHARTATAAKRYIAEHGVASWVEKQNVQHGVAPGSLSARRQYEEQLRSSNVTSASLGARAARRWVQRWRRRWGIRRGKIVRQAPLDAETVVSKESWLCLLQA